MAATTEEGNGGNDYTERLKSRRLRKRANGGDNDTERSKWRRRRKRAMNNLNVMKLNLKLSTK